MRVLIAALGCITILASPAQARWRKAESEHFVIYANDSARDLERFGDMLERFHRAMELATQRTMPGPSPSNRVTIYAVGDETAMRRLAGSNEIAGFYSPGAGSSVAFVQNARPTSGEPRFSLVVLLHEYAHHFSISTSHFSNPPWMTEGSAEFFASARFPSDGGVEIGRAAQHRAGELFYAKKVPIRELLDADLYEQARSDEYDAFYGRAWLLYHYLNLSGQRPGQLGRYIRALAEGQGALAAAQTAFGDLDKLESDLDTYLNQRRISMVTVSPEITQHGPVTVSELSDGMVEVLPLQILTKRGVSREEALDLLPKVRAIAARFPEDAGVLAELAEAELDAGNDAEAIAAADRAIAADPGTVNAYIQKGIALFHLSESAELDAQAAAIDAAMEPFSALNRIENDHPLPLLYFYRTFLERGEQPTELARRALERASELAPFDRSLTMEVAIMMADAGEIEQARLFARVLANDPHGGQLGDFATAFLASLEAAKDGEPFHIDPTAIDENAGNDAAN